MTAEGEGGDEDGENREQVGLHWSVRQSGDRRAQPRRHGAADGWQPRNRLQVREQRPVRDGCYGGASSRQDHQGVERERDGASRSCPIPLRVPNISLGRGTDRLTPALPAQRHERTSRSGQTTYLLG